MPANTPRGLPYPLPTEPVAEGAQAIRNLAEAVDLRVVPHGAPIPWLLAAIPAGYREFDGSPIVQATHPKLYALFGANMPDLRNRFLFGVSGTHPDGQVGGEEAHVLSVAEMPYHGHNYTQNSHGHGGPGNGAALFQQGGGGAVGGGGTATFAPIGGGNADITIGGTGGGGGHNNLPPYRTVRWITAAA